MKIVLILGAGRSSGYLIDYLLKYSDEMNTQIWVADVDEKLAKTKIGNHPNGLTKSIALDDSYAIPNLVSKADFVVSMLPAPMHVRVAQACILYKVSMATASYATSEIRALDQQAKDAGITIMMECGLDPGIDHMSALQLINVLKEKGGVVTSFKSYCGGLPAPESNDNPLHYKISWAPRNVVLAGQGGDAIYRENGHAVNVSYLELFKQVETISVPGLGNLESYPNRDSLSYEKFYGIEGVLTLLRGTLRFPGFCNIWHKLVESGYTDDDFNINQLDVNSYKALTAALDKHHVLENIKEEAEWLGLYSEKVMPPNVSTPAMVLQHVLEDKLMLKHGETDMIVMQHQIGYTLHNEAKHIHSTLVLKGENVTKTAMAKTVGLPLAIAVKRMLRKEFDHTGVQIPIHPSLYIPVLEELASNGITFLEDGAV